MAEVRARTDAEIEAAHAEVSGWYARFYAPLAIASVVLVFLPPFQVSTMGDEGELTVSYGTLFDMARTPGGGPAWVALMLSFAVALMLAVAALRPVHGPTLPGWIAGLGGVIMLMLLTRPATNHPPLSDAGRADMAIAVCVVLVALAHTCHTLVTRRRS
jgi:hypothetical protein